MTDRDIVHVLWHESNIYTGQVTPDDVGEVAMLETVGVLIRDDQDSISVGRDAIRTQTPEEWRGVITIPRSAVVSVTHLRKAQVVKA